MWSFFIPEESHYPAPPRIAFQPIYRIDISERITGFTKRLYWIITMRDTKTGEVDENKAISITCRSDLSLLSYLKYPYFCCEIKFLIRDGRYCWL